jgi:hypothetical protein
MFETNKLDGEVRHLIRNTVAWLLERRESPRA